MDVVVYCAGILRRSDFYSYLIGIHANAQIFCLVCPHIDSVAPPRPQFFQRTLVFGAQNAFFLLVVGWTIIILVRLTTRLRAGRNIG